VAIKGQYVDRRLAIVTAHAKQRYAERFTASGDAETAIRRAWKDSFNVIKQGWWRDGIVSHWVSLRFGMILLVACEGCQLTIVTVMKLDSDQSLGNPKVARAIAEIRRKRRGKA
jgi:hypothetical protein